MPTTETSSSIHPTVNNATLEGASSGLFQVEGNGSELNGITFADGTIVHVDGGTLTLAAAITDETTSSAPGGGLSISGTLSTDAVTNQGSYTKTGNGTTVFSLAFTNAGTVDVQNGTFELSGSVTNNGALHADGGIIDVVSPVTGTGSVVIGNNGLAEFQNTFDQNVTFSGAGTLYLLQPPSFDTSHTIGGFAPNDTLELGGLPGNSFTTSAVYDSSHNTTTLTATDTSQPGSATVTLVGDYSTADGFTWSAVSDGKGGVNLTETPPVGLGDLVIASGTRDLGSTSASATSLTQTGGTLSGTGTLRVTGAMSFTGGSESGSGRTVAQNGVSIATNINNALTITLDNGRILELQGTSTASGNSAHTINMNGGALVIDANSIVNDDTDFGGNGQGVDISSIGGTPVVTNYGTYEKTSSSTQSTINVAFSTNNGNVLVQSGTLDLAAGGTDVGATYEAGAGTIKFGGSTRTLDATAVARARLRLISVWR